MYFIHMETIHKEEVERVPGEKISNTAAAALARKSGNEQLALFYEVAKEGVEKPAYPEPLLELRELYYRNKATINNSSQHLDVVISDTRKMFNDWQSVAYPDLGEMDDDQVDQALFTYFGIKS